LEIRSPREWASSSLGSSWDRASNRFPTCTKHYFKSSRTQDCILCPISNFFTCCARYINWQCH